MTESNRRNLSKPIPERIREAREARGLTAEAFAEYLNVTRQAVAQYESGPTSPSGDVMRQIIAVTKQPPSFFVSPRTRESADLTPFWRGLKRMELHHRKRIARRLEWAADITEFISRFIELPDVNLPSLQFDPDLESFEQIEVAAEAVRDLWQLGRGPIRDLSAHAESNGIILICENVACSDMDAVSCWRAGRPYVLLSTEVESGPRNAFNLAHEIGHVILHQSVDVNSDNLALIEKQANRFAGALLLPQDSFSREVLGTSLGHFKFLKERWGVAIAAMAYRCKDLGMFSQNQLTYLMKQMNIAKIRRHEPLDEIFQMPRPAILRESMKMLVENGVQPKAQIENALCLNMSDIESLCGVPTGYLDTRVVSFTPRRSVDS